MPSSFEGKVSIVTGAGQGIGEGYATGLAAAGASVVVADINTEQAERVAADIVGAGDRAIAVRVDVADMSSAEAMVAATVDAYGGVDHLVNNAAIFAGMKREGLTTVDLDYFYRFMNVNLYGALHCTRAVIAAMVKRGGGSIVNQSSTAAWMAAGYYGLAKLGINGLTVSLAMELGGQNIRVNAIAPGPIATEATLEKLPDGAAEHMTSDRKSTRLNSSHTDISRMPSSA